MTLGPERVAITGVGMVSALGDGAAASFERLARGEVGIGRVTRLDPTGARSELAAEVLELDPSFVPPDERDLWSRTDVMAARAAREAVARAGLELPAKDLALAVGGTTGGMLEAERILAGELLATSEEAARRLLAYPLSTTLDRLSELTGARGHALSVCSACSSGANAILIAASWIASGRAARALAGGSDALCRLTFSGFDALGVTSPGACRPFDVGRTGLTLGEGAAFLLLESESSARSRGAEVLAWLDGWALGAEAHHVTHPEPSAAVATRLLRSALDRAGLEPGDVDYVNAHGTATLQNDAAEARALRAALGGELDRIRVSSSKGQIGHTLGASGALEAAITVLAIQARVAPPTGGLTLPDPELGLRHVLAKADPAQLRAALSSSFGFGGAGTVLAFSEGARQIVPQRKRESALCVRSVATLSVDGTRRNAEIFRCRTSEASGPKARESLLEDLDPRRSRRFDRASALVTLGAAAVLGELDVPREAVGLVVGSAYGNVERSVAFLRRVFERGPRFASPADFPHLVPSAPAGNASIYLGLEGPVLSVADLATSAEAALAAALALLEDGLARVMIAGSAEPHDRIAERLLAPLHSPAPGERGEGASFVCVSRGGSESDVRVEHWSDAAEPADLPPPRGARARAFTTPGGRAWVAQSAWSEVDLEVPEPRVPPEARGGFGLALALATLIAGDADQTLWVSMGRARTYAFVFARDPAVA